MSASATLIAAATGLPLGAALAVLRFPGRRAFILLANALLGLPPVVVGLILYLLLSRSGPFGGLGPPVYSERDGDGPDPARPANRHGPGSPQLGGNWKEYGPALQVDGASPLGSIPHLLAIGQAQLLTTVLAGFGRTISEVGAIIIVGGNIAGYTRTMTTAIALETSKGNLAFALALGLVLVAISIAISAAAFAISGARRFPLHERIQS